MQVTEQAKAIFASLLDGRGEGQVLRLSVAEGGRILTLDQARPGDLTFRHGGRAVLVIAEEVARDLWGLRIDAEEEESGARIVLRRMAGGEPGDTGTAERSIPAIDRRSEDHSRLLEEVNAITARIAALRLSHSRDKVARIRELEAAKQAKWHEIRTLWAAASRREHSAMEVPWQFPPQGHRPDGA